MGKFDSLQKTSFSKKTGFTNAEELYSKTFAIDKNINYEYLENLNIQDLQTHNKKKKYNKDLIDLWAKLEMKSFIDFQLGNTINPYFCGDSEPIAIKHLPDYNYMLDGARIANLLDLKFIKSFTLEGIKFTNIYMAIFEIMDMNNHFRPYIELYTKNNSDSSFVKFAYGYDFIKNEKVELFIDSFNYPVSLSPKGFIELPLSGKIVKLDIYDYITDDDISKILS